MDDSGEHGAAAAVDWAAVRRAYEEGAASLAAIGREHRITPDRLRRRAIAEGWRLRPAAAKPAGRRPVDTAITTLARLVAAQARRFAPWRGPAAALGQAEASRIIDLGKLLEALMHEDRLGRAVETEAAGRRSPGRATGGDHDKQDEAKAADVEWMRAELERRLQVLADAAAGGEAAADPEDAAAGA